MIVLICVFISKIMSIEKHKKKIDYNYSVLRMVLRNISKNEEILIFDSEDDMIFTTHPSLYKTKSDFIKKLLSIAGNSCNINDIVRSIKTNKSCQTVLEVMSNEIHCHKKIIITVTRAESGFFSDSDMQMIRISHIFTKSEIIDDNRVQRELIETLLDRMPIGILYTNKKNEIVDANSTLIQFLNIQKAKIICESVAAFFRGFDVDRTSKGFIIAKRRFLPECECYVVRSLVQFDEDRVIWFLIMVQDLLSSKNEIIEVVADTPHASNNIDNLQEQLLKSTIIPSVILSDNFDIITFNKPFASLNVPEDHHDNNDNNRDTNNNYYNTNIMKYVSKSYHDVISSAAHDIHNNNFSNTIVEIKLHNSNNVFMTYISKIVNENKLLMQLIDISGQKSLERQFLQSQKMQTIGELAGGIAHDFNNILTAIFGFCDLILQRHAHDDRTYSDTQQIKQCTKRASDLVKKLLAFSRRQTLQPEVISISDALYDFSHILKRAAGNGIDLQIIYNRDMWPVEVDVGQLEQVILNLVLNARDAIKRDGTIIIQANNRSVDRPFRCSTDMIKPGDYVVLNVSDNGCGIHESDINKIFDPFFTTKNNTPDNKFMRSGTGLGLSTVYGIIKQTGGFINVSSDIGNGTTFQIYLPRYVGTKTLDSTAHHDASDKIFTDLSGNNTILFVEDEEKVREFACRALKNNGYNVIEATCGSHALEVASNANFDILVTDVLMPKMDGPTLSKKLTAIKPNIKTIFISGYTEDTFRQNIKSNPNVHFIHKPFSMVALLTKIKEVLVSQNTPK